MRTPRRRMKTFHPRVGSRTKRIQKQQLADMEQRLSMHLGDFLVLIGEGSTEQIDKAKLKARSELLKYGADMKKLSEELGGPLSKDVQEFLDSIDNILHSAAGWVDEAKITHCYNMTQKLEKQLEQRKAA